jgi:hypothetical protein
MMTSALQIVNRQNAEEESLPSAQLAMQVGSWQAWHDDEGDVGKGEGRCDKEAVQHDRK